MSSDTQTLSYFNLDKVDKSIGYEKCRSIAVEGIVSITLVIVQHSELVITNNVEFKLDVPVRYRVEGDIRVSTTDLSILRYLNNNNVQQDLSSGTLQIILPGLERVKYPFAVWMYAIRDLFKVANTTEWRSATLLQDEFKHINVSWPSYVPAAVTQELRLYNGAGRTRGKRNYMEDVDFVFESIKISNKQSISVFGVMDGHGGKECAQYCADDIPMRIAANLRDNQSCPEAMYKAFRESDRECLDTNAVVCSGSTANVAVYDHAHNVFYIANTGDTRAVLSRAGAAFDLSYDRKGTDPEEMARVAKAGGFVLKGRLMGSLAVSRALGDLQLKEQGAQNLQRVLIPDPELSCCFLTRREEFVLIATDGLWDVMTSQAAVDFARNLLVQEKLIDSNDVDTMSAPAVTEKLSQIAHNMATHAVSNLNSMDNVTVLIILLRGGPVSCPMDLSVSPAVVGSSSSSATAAQTGGSKASSRSSSRGASPVFPESAFQTDSATIGSTSSTAGADAKTAVGSRWSPISSSEATDAAGSSSSGIAMGAAPSRTKQDTAGIDWQAPTVVFPRGSSLPPTTTSTTTNSSTSSVSNYRIDAAATGTSASSAPPSVGLKKGSSGSSWEDDADLMDFLSDDRNF